MNHGFRIVEDMIEGLNNWMDEKGYKTLDDFRGKSVEKITKWESLDLNYHIVANINQSTCIGCGLCYIACEDGAHQAISVSADPANRIPSIIEENCVGCNLCSLVCPVEACITTIMVCFPTASTACALAIVSSDRGLPCAS